jgi:flavin prenyltransferase
MSKWATVTLHRETPYELKYVEGPAAWTYCDTDQAAPISSGSFKHDGVIVALCSMKTLAGVTAGFADNLIVRAASLYGRLPHARIPNMTTSHFQN